MPDSLYEFVPNINGTVDMLVFDVGENDCHYNDAMAAMAEIYGGTGWVIVDQGSYAENGEFVTLALEASQ